MMLLLMYQNRNRVTCKVQRGFGALLSEIEATFPDLKTALIQHHLHLHTDSGLWPVVHLGIAHHL